MTTTRPSSVQVGPEGHTTGGPEGGFSPEPGATRVEVGVGRRVMVVSDLLLTPEATPSSRAITTELARALDTWDGPGILVVAGNLFDLTGCAAGGCDAGAASAQAARALDAHPELADALGGSSAATSAGSSARPAPTNRATAGDPTSSPASAAHRVEQRGPHRPPPAHRGRVPGGPGRAGRARLRPRLRRARDRIRSRRRHQAGDRGRQLRRTRLALAVRPFGGRRAVARRARPAERPFGPVALRGLAHHLPSARTLRLVAAGPLRRGRAAAGGGDAVGARAPRLLPHRPGHPSRPPGRLGRPGGRGHVGRPGRAGRAGPGARTAQPADVVGPRRGGARRGARRGGGQRHRPRRGPPAGRAGVRRPRHRRHLPVGADPSRASASTPTWGPRPRWSRSTAGGSGCRRSSWPAGGSAGSSSRPAPTCTCGCCSAGPTWRPRACSNGR